MGGLLHLEQRGRAWAGCVPSPLLAVPNVTSTASVPIMHYIAVYDGPLFCGFDVAIKGLSSASTGVLRDCDDLLFICLSVCLFVRLSVCSSVCQFNCLCQVGTSEVVSWNCSWELLRVGTTPSTMFSHFTINCLVECLSALLSVDDKCPEFLF